MDESIRLLEESFRRFIRLHRQKKREIFFSYGLYSGQPPILFTLLETDGCTQKEIAQRLSISQATVAVSIRRLLKGGFISKSADDKDLRRNRIELTPKGREAALASRSENDRLFGQMCAGLSPDEIERLSEYFLRLGDNLVERV